MAGQREMSAVRKRRERFVQRYGRSQEEVRGCRDYVKKWWPEETAHRLRVADEVTGQMFLFDLPWDMEQTAEPVTFAGEIDWMYQPGADPEFIYQMNRHAYWICLGQAYAVTGEAAYAECFARQLVHWIDHNPITEETKPRTWRTIEAGIRGANWMHAMSYFADSEAVTDPVFGRFLDSMEEHGAYLAACDVPFSVKSNWGVLENSGLYDIACMLEHVGGYPQAEDWKRTAKARLVRQLAVQVMSDGVHWEMSPMYHNEVLRCCMEVLRTARICGDSFPEVFEKQVRRMAMADRIWQKPDGSQPAGGDSDVTDLRDVLTECGYWFGDSVLKSGGYKRMDFEGIWNYGTEAAGVYEAIPAECPDKLYNWLEDSGNWYLRSSWEKDADYLHMRCGSLGGGHGHFDKGHLDLVIGGEDVLVDPGRFTYVDGGERRMLKSTRAHNAVIVDGLEYSRCLDSWGVAGLWPAVRGMMYCDGPYCLMECGHLGYVEQGVYAQRRVLAIGTRIYLVMDTCYGSGEHTLRQHFHPAPGLRISRTEQGFVLEGERVRAEFYCVAEGCTVTEEEFVVSEHYNRKRPGRLVTCEKRGSGVFGMVTVIVCEEKAGAECRETAVVHAVPVASGLDGTPLERQEGDGVSVQVGETAWTVVNMHAEAGARCEYVGAGESYGLGRVMIAEAGQKDMTVLRW